MTVGTTSPGAGCLPIEVRAFDARGTYLSLDTTCHYDAQPGPEIPLTLSAPKGQRIAFVAIYVITGVNATDPERLVFDNLTAAE